MTEALIIAGFLLLLMILQYKEQRKIELAAKSSGVKKLITVGLAALLLTIFWSNHLADQIKLVVFAILILLFGFMKEGFSKDHLIKLGVLEGDFHAFKKIQIEELSNQTQFVSFYKSKNNRLSLVFDATQEELIAYFEKNDLHDRIVIGEENE